MLAISDTLDLFFAVYVLFFIVMGLKILWEFMYGK
jgi:hypothetical protein